MKILFLAIPVIFILSCRNTKAMSKDTIEQFGREEQVTDSVLHELQKNNDVVIAFAVAHYAWVKMIRYDILAMRNNEWKAYTYTVNNTNHTSSGLSEVAVLKDSAESVWKFIQQKEAAKIKGDNGEDFCSGDKKSTCNINDGANWQLLFITKTSIADPSYYEPQFYENCCPGNTDRQLFIEVANKIKNAVEGGGTTVQ